MISEEPEDLSATHAEQLFYYSFISMNVNRNKVVSCPPALFSNVTIHAGSSVAAREAGGFIDTSTACSEASYLIAYVLYSGQIS